MDPRLAAEVVRELQARTRGSSSLIEDTFPKQRAFVGSTAKMRAALCTRRAGKTTGGCVFLVDGALRWPGTSSLYMALTRGSAKRAFWTEVLKPFCAKYAIPVDFNESELTASFRNGSHLYLLGADATKEEREKALGSKLRRVVVDECASFRNSLHELVYSVLRPALVDLGGELAMIGTPGVVKNYFHEVTQADVSQRPKGWDVHTWSAEDNPHIATQWATEIAALLEENPRVVDTPWYRMNYLGEWAIDTTKLVYRYDAERNDIGALPDAESSAWRYSLGVDLGYNDPTAIVVGATRPNDPTLYLVHGEKRPNLIISQVADWIRALRDRYAIHSMVVDNASKQAVEELRQRYALPLEPAEKTGKADAIAMMNSDLITGRVRVVAHACAPLLEEWGGLVWDEKSLPKLEEHPGCANHLCDASLYLWRSATNYTARPAPVKHARGSPEEQEAWDDEEEERAARADRRRVPFWERDD